MRAMVFERAGTPLREAELEQPVPGPGEVRLRVRGCGVCRTDLHIVDGELAEPKLPLVLGHQIVATVAERGPDAKRFEPDELVGVPVARLDVRQMPLLPLRAREPLRQRA